ncbi:MAG TPA: hypothetical protein VHY22_13310 [Chthoniobacteraceae bacterium]|jgi:4-amino-4-deoxy-L-arabinose transferase-like glycosyltransferase|nr:hypothetical protein [Chthoniobacteraceae bacterium]
MHYSPQQNPGSTDSWLPPRGFERIAFLVLIALTLALKVLAIQHFRSDSDETQHAHVVWSWVTGQLQYRDVFDNHMPLFQMLCAPVMAFFGERADIMICLRWVLLPFYFISLFAVYRLTESLYSRRAALWSALFAATAYKFFYTSTEFRTDQLWAAFWLLGLMVLAGGEFTFRRAFLSALLIGLSGAVSVKSVPLVVALGASAAVAFGIGWLRGERQRLGPSVAKLAVGAAAMLIPSILVILYFVKRGVFWSMYYCVIAHNMVPGLKRWGNFSLHQWYFPLSVPLLAAYAWLIFRQTPIRSLAIRRALILLMPWFFVFILMSYWPDITREDDLPYVPLIPLSLFPLVILAGKALRGERLHQLFWTYGVPALALGNLAFTYHYHNIREDRMQVTTHNIADVLALTRPDDFVMDDKGDYVYRRRAYYWVLEPITKARFRLGLIHGKTIPQRLTETGTKVCSLVIGKEGSLASQFIEHNYLPCDPNTRDLGVLGKIIGRDASGGTDRFDVVIPQQYAVTTESGTLAGELDGKPYTGPVWLAAGTHTFHRTSGNGRVAIFLADAAEKGFKPLYDLADELMKERGTFTPDKRNRAPELQ